MSLPQRPVTPPPPANAQPDHSGATPNTSTFSPVLPKSKRQIAGSLPSTSAAQQSTPSRNNVAVGLFPLQQQPQGGVTSSSSSRYPNDDAAMSTPTQQYGGGGGGAAAVSRYHDASTPQRLYGGGGASLRQSTCAALGGLHLGRLSTHAAVGTPRQTSLSPTFSNTVPSLEPPPPLFAPPSTSSLHVVEDVHPEDAVSQARCRETSPIAVDCFLATSPPRGRYVLFNMLSTWGDPNEVGLCEIQIFDGQGNLLVPCPTQDGQQQPPVPFTLVADTLPSSSDSRGTSPPHLDNMNASFGTQNQSTSPPSGARGAHTNSPLNGASSMQGEAVDGFLARRRDAQNIVNGKHNTSDEQEMYVTPFVDGRHHIVCIVFQKLIDISAIRIFNYSGGGRSKTNKGVRLMEITVDDQVVFRGEIAQSSGGGGGDGDTTNPADDGGGCDETILFTEDREVLTAMLLNAKHNSGGGGGNQIRHHHQAVASSSSSNAATTVAPSGSIGLRSSIAFVPTREVSTSIFSPDVAAGSTPTPQPSLTASPSTSLSTSAGVGMPCVFPTDAPKGVTSMCLQVHTTWGDEQFVGLSGLRLRDPHGRLIYNIAHCIISRPSGKKDSSDGDFTALFDGNPNTAVAWSFEPGLQIILAFQQPVDVGFIEIANYSLGRRTYCGIKMARLFYGTLPSISFTPNNTTTTTAASLATSSLMLTYARLWDADVDSNPKALPGIVELTPSEGIMLRKASSALSSHRFQSFDLSLAAYGGASSSGDSASQSLRLSMNTRAAVAIRRARQALLEPPEWLLAAQGYLPSILPVAYVFKVTVSLAGVDGLTLKALLKSWASHPMESVSFLSDDGSLVDSNSLWCEGLVSYGDNEEDAQAESALNGDEEDGLQRIFPSAVVDVSLVFVADSPFAISALFLRSALSLQCGGHASEVVEGSSWVRRVSVVADDAVIFESLEASMYATPTNGRVIRPTIPSTVFFTLDERVLNAYHVSA